MKCRNSKEFQIEQATASLQQQRQLLFFSSNRSGKEKLWQKNQTKEQRKNGARTYLTHFAAQLKRQNAAAAKPIIVISIKTNAPKEE